MTEKLDIYKEILEMPEDENTYMGIIVRFKDGSDPFLFLRTPNKNSTIMIRDSEAGILSEILRDGYSRGFVEGEDYADRLKPKGYGFPDTPQVGFLLIEEDSADKFATEVLGKFSEDSLQSYSREEFIYRRLKLLFTRT